ncbi:MAG: hypothetical protein AAFZ15_05875 [Bacteroidota bacterium]
MNSFSTKYRFRENVFVLGVFLAVVHLLYAPAWQSGFVTDFTGLQERLDGAPFRDFLHCFGFPALHQVTNFFLFLFYKWFGTSPLPWYLVYTSLHVVNGWLGYQLVKQVLFLSGAVPLPGPLQRESPPRPIFPLWRGPGGRSLEKISIPAFIAVLLFLVSPYNAETVIWKVCFNFLFCTAMMLSSILLLIKYLKQEKKLSLIYSYLFFLVALFTFELALALPLMVLVIIFWNNSTSTTGQSEKHSKLLTSIPYFILSGFYFLLNKILLGGWVGHYGESVHLNFDLKNMAANCLKYFFKNLLYWRELDHGTKQALISFCENPITVYTFLTAGITILFSLLIVHKKLNNRIKSVFFSWLLFFLALAPIANLYVAWLLHGENDRYGYFASLFFYAALIISLRLINKKMQALIIVSLFGLSIFNLNKINNYWKNSTLVMQGLFNDFKWQSNSEIYILAFPENYKGIPMFKDFSRQDLALKSALKYLPKKNTAGKFYQVAQFNMNSPTDGLSANIDSANTIKLEFHEWGSWWWRHGIGTGDYSTEKYEFKTVGKGAEIKIKNTAKDAAFIYSDGDKWKEVFLNTETRRHRE